MDRIEALRLLIEEAVERLAASPRDAAYIRALEATYIKPAPSQALAAERLDLPFSTFRRHLGRGIELIVEALWEQEIG